MNAQFVDSTVYNMLAAQCSHEDIIVALASEKAQLLKRIVELESICPKKYVTPNGVQIWQCPVDLIPVTRTIS